jgi:hypothetical protein
MWQQSGMNPMNYHMNPNFMGSPGFTPLSTGKFGGMGFRNQLSSRNSSNRKEVFPNHDEFTLDGKFNMEPDTQRFFHEIEQAKKNAKMECKSTNTTFVVPKEEALNKSGSPFIVDSQSMMSAFENTLKNQTTPRLQESTIRAFDTHHFNTMESMNNEIQTLRNHNKDHDKSRSDFEGLSISKIEKVDEGVQYEGDTLELDNMSSKHHYHQREHENTEQMDQRFLNNISTDRHNVSKTHEMVPKVEIHQMNTMRENINYDLPKPVVGNNITNLPKATESLFLRNMIPKNEGTMDSMASEREIIKLKVPEDTNRNVRNSEIG